MLARPPALQVTLVYPLLHIAYNPKSGGYACVYVDCCSFHLTPSPSHFSARRAAP